MDPETEARFQKIESLLHAMAERENRMDIRWDQKHAIAMQRMDRMDKQLQATANLVRAGMKIVGRLVRDNREMKAEMRQMKAEMQADTKEMKAAIRQLAQRQDAFLRAFRNGDGHRKN